MDKLEHLRNQLAREKSPPPGVIRAGSSYTLNPSGLWRDCAQIQLAHPCIAYIGGEVVELEDNSKLSEQTMWNVKVVTQDDLIGRIGVFRDGPNGNAGVKDIYTVWPAPVWVEDGTPAIGEEVGVKAGSARMHVGRVGFTVESVQGGGIFNVFPTRGDPGVRGFQGFQGVLPHTIIGGVGPPGPQGNDGDYYIDETGSEVFPEGPQGFQGWQGTGPQGYQGYQGYQGWQGWQGRGAQGWQGPVAQEQYTGRAAAAIAAGAAGLVNKTLWNGAAFVDDGGNITAINCSSVAVANNDKILIYDIPGSGGTGYSFFRGSGTGGALAWEPINFVATDYYVEEASPNSSGNLGDYSSVLWNASGRTANDQVPILKLAYPVGYWSMFCLQMSFLPGGFNYLGWSASVSDSTTVNLSYDVYAILEDFNAATTTWNTLMAMSTSKVRSHIFYYKGSDVKKIYIAPCPALGVNRETPTSPVGPVYGFYVRITPTRTGTAGTIWCDGGITHYGPLWGVKS